MSSFKCFKCQGVFKKGWSEEKAMLEYQQALFQHKEGSKDQLCDDCYREFLIWYESLTPDDHKRIEEESNE